MMDSDSEQGVENPRYGKVEFLTTLSHRKRGASHDEEAEQGCPIRRHAGKVVC